MKKTPQEIQEEIEKLLEENECSIEIEINDPKIKIISKEK